MIAVGERAPAFTLADQRGTLRSLDDFRGLPLVLYFYPKDDTPGCTVEACEFRDAYAEFEGLAAVVGVSPDSVESHAAFAAKHALPIILLADPATQVLRAYGAWGAKTMYGKRYEGVLRSTVLIDAQGIVRKTYANVRPEGHAAEILEDLRALRP